MAKTVASAHSVPPYYRRRIAIPAGSSRNKRPSIANGVPQGPNTRPTAAEVRSHYSSSRDQEGSRHNGTDFTDQSASFAGYPGFRRSGGVLYRYRFHAELSRSVE